MPKKRKTSDRGHSRQRVAAQEVAPTANLFDAKIPEIAFSASKSDRISGRFDAAEAEITVRFHRRWPEKNGLFDAAEGLDFVPPGPKRREKREEGRERREGGSTKY